MDDQVYNLRQKGVSAEMLSSASTQDESRAIMKRMLGDSQPKGKGKAGKGKAKVEDDAVDASSLIKMVYVTPERIEKSKTFMSTLQKSEAPSSTAPASVPDDPLLPRQCTMPDSSLASSSTKLTAFRLSATTTAPPTSRSNVSRHSSLKPPSSPPPLPLPTRSSPTCSRL